MANATHIQEEPLANYNFRLGKHKFQSKLFYDFQFFQKIKKKEFFFSKLY